MNKKLQTNESKAKIAGGFTIRDGASSSCGVGGIPPSTDYLVPNVFGTTTLFDLCTSSYGNRCTGKRKKASSEVKAKEKVISSGHPVSESRLPVVTTIQQQQQNKDLDAMRAPAGPQVEIINGKIVIRESSLVVNNDPTGDEEYEEVTEGIHATATYSSFLKRRKSIVWGFEETRIFYNCLRQCGTEFSMMQAFFPGRTRKQLKKKFYREEKEHPELVKQALYTSLPLEMTPFEAQLGLSSNNENDDARIEEDSDIHQSKRGRSRSKKKGPGGSANLHGNVVAPAEKEAKPPTRDLTVLTDIADDLIDV